jgi:hypothetical protein
MQLFLETLTVTVVYLRDRLNVSWARNQKGQTTMLTLATRARVQRPFASNPLLQSATLSFVWAGKLASGIEVSSGDLVCD